MRSRFLLSVRIAPAESGTLPHGQVAGPSSGQFPSATLDKRGMYSAVCVHDISFTNSMQKQYPSKAAKHKDLGRARKHSVIKGCRIHFFDQASASIALSLPSR